MSAAAVLAQPMLELSDFQRKVLLTPEDHDLVLAGGRGGAKSHTIAINTLRHAEQHGNAARMLFVRKSFPGIVDFEQTTRDVFGLVYGRAASYNAASHIWRFPNGATLQLDQLESQHDFGKFQGKSFTLIATDEAGQYADLAALDLLRSCLRAPRPIHPRFILAANPGGPGHGWISRRHVFHAAPWTPYIEEKTGRKFINCPSTYRDNPFIDQEEYRRQLEASTATDPELGRAWVEGDWSVARGAYFSAVLDPGKVMVEPWEPGSVSIATSNFQSRACSVPFSGVDKAAVRHRIWQRLADGRDPWQVYLAHDFGVSAPSVTYVVAESPGTIGPDNRFYPRGSIVLLDELATHEPGSLERGMGYTVPILAERIKELAKVWRIRPEGVADDAIFARTGSSAGSIAEEFARQGVNFRRARKGDRVAGWERMRRLLQAAGSVDQPGLYVSRACEYWWSTVPVLPRDPRKPDDVDSRAADHAADASRYAILGAVPVPVAQSGVYHRR